MKPGKYFGILLAILPALAPGQGRDSIRVQMESVEEAGATRVEVWCENLAFSARSFTYELRLERQDEDGNISSSVQGGSFSMPGGSAKLLCTTSVNRLEEDYFMAQLRVYESARLVAAAHKVEGQRYFGKLSPVSREKVQASQREESGGADILLLDQTRTRAGRDFFYAFQDAWEPPAEARDYVIRIEELPFRGMASWARIFIDEGQAFEYPLQPQPQYIEELARMAAAAVSRELEIREETKKSLEREDKEGSGLY